MPSESEITSNLELLRSKDNKQAYSALKMLLAASAESDEVYNRLDAIIPLLDSTSSYERNRAIALIAANAMWDKAGKVDVCLDEYLSHLEDNKPITARQCIKGVVAIAKVKPDLKPYIVEALRKVDPSRYASSMRDLVRSDIINALAELDSPEA